MKLKLWIVIGAFPALLTGSCARQASKYTPEGKHFTNEVMNGMTPVKNQGKSQTCWIYAMLATIETEHLSWSTR